MYIESLHTVHHLTAGFPHFPEFGAHSLVAQEYKCYIGDV